METTLDSQRLVRLLAEDTRRKVVAALVLADGPQTAAEVATATGLALRAVVDAGDRLVAAGLVDNDSGTYRLDTEVFQQVARAEAPLAPPSAHADKPAEEAKVLDIAFKHGRLVQWPAKRAKRLMVLDHLAQHFDIGTRYAEPEVNKKLRQFGDDVATMRRYLVDEQFLDRSNGEYWRCGGSV